MRFHHSVPPRSKTALLIIVALLFTIGCKSLPGNKSSSLSGAIAPPAEVAQLQDQFLTHVVGADGRVRMPIDIVEHQNPAPQMDDASTREDEAEVIHLTCDGLADGQHLKEQVQTLHCWAAAIQTVESYKSIGHGPGNTSGGADENETIQNQIAARVISGDDLNQAALSSQIIFALGVDPTQDASPDHFEFVATVSEIADLAYHRDEEDWLRRASDVLDQYMGVQEMVASLHNNEPVLVSLNRFPDEPNRSGPPYRHIYVLYAADVVKIPQAQSREWKLRKLHQGINAAIGISEDDSAWAAHMMPLLTRNGEHFAIKQVHLFNPDKREYDGINDYNPQSQFKGHQRLESMDGSLFRDRLVYMMNRPIAQRIVAESSFDDGSLADQSAVPGADKKSPSWWDRLVNDGAD